MSATGRLAIALLLSGCAIDPPLPAAGSELCDASFNWPANKTNVQTFAVATGCLARY